MVHADVLILMGDRVPAYVKTSSLFSNREPNLCGLLLLQQGKSLVQLIVWLGRGCRLGLCRRCWSAWLGHRASAHWRRNQSEAIVLRHNYIGDYRVVLDHIAVRRAILRDRKEQHSTVRQGNLLLHGTRAK